LTEVCPLSVEVQMSPPGTTARYFRIAAQG
jgi:hypothetical protein